MNPIRQSPAAIGLAITLEPVPLTAFLLVLASERGVRKRAAFALGWVASFLEAIAKTRPVIEFTPLAFAGNDDGDVLLFIRYAFTVTATGKHVA